MKSRCGKICGVGVGVAIVALLLAQPAAADWFSGDGAYFTPGFIYNRWNFTLYVGYGLANTGRQDDLVTLELGYTFPPWGKKKSQ